VSGDRLALTVEEAARRLGMSRKALYNHLAAGRIPCKKLGRRVLIPVAAIERWLEEAGLPAGEGVAR
jgi:excisionase family DNA binding protein